MARSVVPAVAVVFVACDSKFSGSSNPRTATPILFTGVFIASHSSERRSVKERQ
jgi:hypothetical protein